MADDEIGVRLKLKDRDRFHRDAKDSADDVEKIGDKADKAGKKAQGAGAGFGILAKGLRGVGGLAKAGAVGLGIAAVATGALSFKLVGLGMDAGETQSKFNTVFQGIEADVNSFIKTTNQKFGIPTKELQDAASTFGVFGQAAGVAQKDLAKFSTDLVTAGLDFASFYNIAPEEAFLSLRSGLAGEAEPMRKFGIFMNEAAVAAKALEMGLGGAAKDTKAIAQARTAAAIATAKAGEATRKYGMDSVQAQSALLSAEKAQDRVTKAMEGTKVELTDAQKVMARQAFIMDSMGVAQGDLSRTSQSLANQTRGLKGRLQEAGTTIGLALVPHVEDLVGWLNDKLQPAIAWLQVNAAPMADRFAGGLGRARDAGAGLLGVFQGGGIMAVAGELDTMTGAGGRLSDAIGWVKRVGSDLITIWQDLIQPTSGLRVASFGLFGMLTLVDDVVGFLARHSKTLRPIVIGLTAAYVAHKVVMGSANAILKAHETWTTRTTIAEKRATIAKAAGVVWTGAQTVATGALTVAQGALNAVMALNPIMLLVIAIALLVGGLVLAYQKSETFRNIVQGAFSMVIGAAGAVMGFFQNNWPLLLAIITGPFGLAILAITRNWDTIKDTATRVFGGLKDIMLAPVNAFIKAWNALDVGIDISIPSWVPGVGGKGFKIDDVFPDVKVPGLWQGGTTMRGGAVRVGEFGPEVLHLPPAASVVPLADDLPDPAELRGRTGTGEVLRLEVDGKVLAEVLLDELRDQDARS